MGDRVSISFKKGDDESVCLFHHWGGQDFPRIAQVWLEVHERMVDKHREKNISCPISRLDVDNLMLQFIRYLSAREDCNGFYGKHGERNPDFFTSSLYLGGTKDDGDNSDNGHFTIEL